MVLHKLVSTYPTFGAPDYDADAYLLCGNTSESAKFTENVVKVSCKKCVKIMQKNLADVVKYLGDSND